MTAPSKLLDQYTVRFPDGMRDEIKTAAKTSERSMNAEIVFRLRKSFEEKSGSASAPKE